MPAPLVPVLLLLVAAQEALSPPSWMHAYPGTMEQVKASPSLVETSYTTEAAPPDVVAHYADLFAEQGLPFHPQQYGTATLIRGATPGYGLTIQIRKRGTLTSVVVTCTERPIIPRVTQDDVVRSMQEYDQPVYPRPQAPMPALAWPSWLTHPEGAALRVEKGVDRFKLNYLQTEFDSTWDRASLQRFYSGLLSSYDYRVTAQSSPITPLDRQAIIEGAHSFSNPGPRFVIRVELKPAAAGVHVVLRITGHR